MAAASIPHESPPANALVVTSIATARAAVAALDAHFGLPAAAAYVKHGDTPTPAPCAVTFAAIIAHPTLQSWALPIPQAQSATVLQALAKAGVVAGQPAPLAASWTGFALAWPLPADIAAAQQKVGAGANVVQDVNPAPVTPVVTPNTPKV